MTGKNTHLPAHGDSQSFCMIEVLVMSTGKTRYIECFPDKPDCCLPLYTRVSPSLWDMPLASPSVAFKTLCLLFSITHSPLFQDLEWSKPAFLFLNLPSQVSLGSSGWGQHLYISVVSGLAQSSCSLSFVWYIDGFPKAELLCEPSACSLRPSTSGQ